jgi:hypothetical protein
MKKLLSLKKQNYLQQNWLSLLIIVAVQIAVVLFYLYKLSQTTSLGVPLDDTYIHYQYAKNLAAYGKLEFNHGEPSLGTTSILWILLLAIFFRIGNIILISILLGVFFSLVSALCIFEIAKGLLKNNNYALFVALLFILCGNNIWFSLSGMETTMFVALGLLSIVLYSKNKIGLSSICSGLLSLTRPEGMILIWLIFCYEVIKQYQNKVIILKRLLVLLIIPALFILPYLFYNIHVNGQLLPSTFSGRRWVAGLPKQVTLSEKNFWFIFAWPYRIVAYTFMADLFADYIPLLLSILIGIIPVFLVLLGFSKYWNLNIESFKLKIRINSSLVILFFWCIFHNVIYWIFFPVLSHAGRYQAINLVMVWLFIGIGIITCGDLLKSKFKIVRIELVLTTLFIYVFAIMILSTWSWSELYVSSTIHINNVHVKAGKWINSNTPIDSVIAAFDIGAVKYYSNRCILDLGGLIDQKYQGYLWNNTITEYMKLKNATYLAMPELYENKQNDLIYSLGIYQYNSEKYELEKINSFVYPNNIKWNEHWNAVGNAYPKMTIFRINWY